MESEAEAYVCRINEAVHGLSGVKGAGLTKTIRAPGAVHHASADSATIHGELAAFLVIGPLGLGHIIILHAHQ